jgi:hypothetical protein
MCHVVHIEENEDAGGLEPYKYVIEDVQRVLSIVSAARRHTQRVLVDKDARERQAHGIKTVLDEKRDVIFDRVLPQSMRTAVCLEACPVSALQMEARASTRIGTWRNPQCAGGCADVELVDKWP